MKRGLDSESLDTILRSLAQFGNREIPRAWRLKADASGEFPEATLRQLMSEIGLHLILIPEAYGGLGGGAYDIYRVSEAMAGLDLGLATSFLAIALGMDPIAVGGTEEQKQLWMGRIAEEGLLVGYGVTEPTAGSDLSTLRTKAEPVERDGQLWGYRINGEKQFITNGGVASLFTVLAQTEAGPTFFVVESGTPGLSGGKHEDKHGIRISNTAPLTLEDVEVPLDHLIGGELGRGLAQAQEVFGYTRLMVAAFGLGAGVAALERAAGYARERRQGGSLLSEKQAFTHKLIVPHAARLAAARAYIEEVADRLDSGEHGLQTEGAIAKLCATEAGNAAADAAIQAHGGYGYIREYEVEKIRRDVRITTIYEGTSEIMQWTIGRDLWRAHLQTQGRVFADRAQGLLELGARAPAVGAATAALAVQCLAELFERARKSRLTRHQHILFRLGELVMQVETAGALCRAAAAGTGRGPRPDAETHKAMARLTAREAAAAVAAEATRWLIGADAEADVDERALRLGEIRRAQKGLLADMDTIAAGIFGAAAEAGEALRLAV
jgi:alkylation response protein AidB-like acyl-CoA dehydrogenase